MSIKVIHKPYPIYDLLRSALRKIPIIDNFLMNWVRRFRLRHASIILEAVNFYPEARAEILADYEYSIAITHRGIMQVLNIESMIRYIESANIEGAFVEAGTYTGGASAYALLSLQRLRSKKGVRTYWGFDSFEGMPAPSQNDGDHGSLWVTGKSLNKISASELGSLVGHDANKADFAQCLNYLQGTGYPKEHINLVKGWFQYTLKATKAKIGAIAFLRLDGDFYESTKVVFAELYEQVVGGGVIVIDDFGSFQGCRRATEELFANLNIDAHLVYVENGIRYFIKPKIV